MGHFFSSDPPPPVIPGGTEKMGHFFSSDPESTGAEVRKCLSFSDMTGHIRNCAGREKGKWMKKIPFVKYTMHGNKFTIVDETLKPVLTESEKSSFAYRATDIYYGVGADGLLVIQPFKPHVLKKINETYHYWNNLPQTAESEYILRLFESNRKEAFSCGNGLLCISDYLYQRYGVKSARIMTEVPTSTPKVLTIGTDLQKKMNWANMGPPVRIPSEMTNLPVTIPHDGFEFVENIKVNFSSNGITGGEKKTSLKLSGYLVFTGEPHLVIFTDSGFSPKELTKNIFNSSKYEPENSYKRDFSSRMIYQIGMSLNKDYLKYFPSGLNVNFVRVVDGIIEYRCFERGIDRETWACGTGAVAVSFIAKRLNMLTGNKITVWPYLSRLRDEDVQLYVVKSENDYILYGNPIFLFEGVFFDWN